MVIVSSEVIPSYKVIVDRPYILRTEELMSFDIVRDNITLFAEGAHRIPKFLS